MPVQRSYQCLQAQSSCQCCTSQQSLLQLRLLVAASVCNELTIDLLEQLEHVLVEDLVQVPDFRVFSILFEGNAVRVRHVDNTSSDLAQEDSHDARVLLGCTIKVINNT